MDTLVSAKLRKMAMALATITVSTSLALSGAAPSAADPYDDDGDGTSYVDDGGAADDSAADNGGAADDGAADDGAADDGGGADEQLEPVDELGVGADEPSAADQPANEEPAGADQPANEESAGADQPANEEAPGADQPANEEAPGADQPANEEAPGADQPANEEPAGADQPANEESAGADQPANEEPAGGAKPSQKAGSGGEKSDKDGSSGDDSEKDGSGTATSKKETATTEPSKKEGSSTATSKKETASTDPSKKEGSSTATSTKKSSAGDADGGELVKPERLNAPKQEVAAARKSAPVPTRSAPASPDQVKGYAKSIESTYPTSLLGAGMALKSPVTQWNPAWLRYSRYYRPILTNPFATPMQVLYEEGGQTRVLTVPPRQQVVLDVPKPGVYHFTAITGPASGPISNVSVGSFSGGGYKPAPGQPAPQKPAPLKKTDNALVQVKFDRGSSAPFRVGSVADLGADPAVNGMTRVLIDGEAPAWGQWSKDANGRALFEIKETQIPGLQPPAQGVLPGYEIELAASEQDGSWLSRNLWLLIGTAVGVVALGILAARLLAKRRAPTQG